MTTADSSLAALQEQAGAIAEKLKAMAPAHVERGAEDIKFGIVMDDKIVKIEMSWDMINRNSEAELTDFILKYMQMRK
jgi:hypothetical protein